MADGAPLHRVAAAVVVWFVLNIAMSNILKWTYVYGALTTPQGVRQYRFPLFISFLHMLASWIMCGLFLRFVKGWPEKVLTFRQQVRVVWPLSVCFALSIASNNLSLLFIYPSLNQMLGSLGPLVTVGLAVMVSGTRYNIYTWTSMLGISGGLVLCAKFDVDFNLVGVSFAMTATLLRGLKSIIQQRILTEKVDSLLLLFYMAPSAGASMLLGSVLQEGTEPIKLLLRSEPAGARVCVLLLALGSCNACLLNLSNFLVTKYTSAVTLQVLGNVKSCLNIGVSVLIFGNSVREQQAIGVAVCMAGTWVYNRKGGKLEAGTPCLPIFGGAEGAAELDCPRTAQGYPTKSDSLEMAGCLGKPAADAGDCSDDEATVANSTKGLAPTHV